MKVVLGGISSLRRCLHLKVGLVRLPLEWGVIGTRLDIMARGSRERLRAHGKEAGLKEGRFWRSRWSGVVGVLLIAAACGDAGVLPGGAGSAAGNAGAAEEVAAGTGGVAEPAAEGLRQSVGRNEDGSPESATAAGRWYSAERVAVGARVFGEHCAECHGGAAQGIVEDWRVRLPDGSFPPPPLNGSAHAWHHPLSVLLMVIDRGGVPLGGQMPAFVDVLDEEEQLAAVAWFQEFWSDEIYRQWLLLGGVDR